LDHGREGRFVGELVIVLLLLLLCKARSAGTQSSDTVGLVEENMVAVVALVMVG
jgi:hypothetical protein